MLVSLPVSEVLFRRWREQRGLPRRQCLVASAYCPGGIADELTVGQAKSSTDELDGYEWCEGRGHVTATVAWDGDTGGNDFFAPGLGGGEGGGEGGGRLGGGREKEKEGRVRVRTGYLLGRHGVYHLLPLPAPLVKADKAYNDWKEYKGTQVEKKLNLLANSAGGHSYADVC